jgi:glycosyltransferase involved in cell wall biosynthesis
MDVTMNPRSLRVLVLSGLDKKRFYGQSTRPYYLSRFLAEKGCIVLHLYPGPPNDHLSNESFVAIRGGRVHAIRSVVKIVVWPAFFRPDIIYTHQLAGWPTRVGRFLAILLRRPLVIDVHGLDSQEKLATHLFSEGDIEQIEKYERRMLHAADTIVVVSNELHECVQRTFGIPDERIALIPNGVDVGAFDRTVSGFLEKKIRREYRIPENSRVVTFTCPRIESFLSNEIALRWFFVVVQRINAVRKDVTFLVLGGGKQIPPPCECVIYTGFVEDIHALLLISDVCVLPYPPTAVCGGVRNKALEYFAARRPVVSTSEGMRGIPDAVPSRDYLLAEEVEAFAKATLRLLDSPSLTRRIGSNGAELAKRYDWSISAEKLLSLLLRSHANARSHRR